MGGGVTSNAINRLNVQRVLSSMCRRLREALRIKLTGLSKATSVAQGEAISSKDLQSTCYNKCKIQSLACGYDRL